MTPSELSDWLTRSFEDRHLSRRERQSLRELVVSLDSDAIAKLREHAFQLARQSLAQGIDATILTWLEEVVTSLDSTARGSVEADPQTWSEAFFSPGEDCPRAIEQFLRRARKSIDICVFTITDDRLAQVVLEAHQRNIAVRILTDNDKAEDLGSDIDRFASAGLAVRVDRSPFHMHHKFAIGDGEALLTGSYNWTRGAARDNQENLVITNDPRLVGAFQAAFERLWNSLGDHP